MNMRTNRIAKLPLAVASVVNWGVLNEECMEAIEKAVGNKILGPALTRYLRREGWREINCSGHAFIERARFPGNPGDIEIQIPTEDDAKFLLRFAPCEYEQKGEGKVEFGFFKAEDIYVANWWEEELYSDKGREHVAHFGLEFCLSGDAYALGLVCQNLPDGKLWPLHNLFEMPTGRKSVFQLNANKKTVALGSRGLLPNQQVREDQIIILRYKSE